MATLSKLFQDTVQHCSCDAIVHSGSCTRNILINIHKFFLSNAKYFAPLVGLPLIVHIRSLNKDVLISAIRYYIGSVWCGATTGLCIAALICLFRHIFGGFKHYSFVFAPSLIGGFALLATPNMRVHRLFETSVFQCTIESFLMKRQNILTKSIADSVLLQTAIFMSCSALILQAKREKLYNGFWLLTPTTKPTVKTNASATDAQLNHKVNALPHSCCSHVNNTCVSHIVSGMRNYLIFGLALDSIRMLMNKIPASAQSFNAKLLAKLRNFKIRSSALLATYMAIYRLVHCWLNRKSGADTTTNHAIAAFLSGSCYMFYPKLTLLSFAILLSAQLLWQRFKIQQCSLNLKVDDSACSVDVRSIAFEWFQKVPYSKLLYPLSLAYLVHTYCFQRYCISSLAETIINGVTDNYASRIRQSMDRLQKQLAVTVSV